MHYKKYGTKVRHKGIVNFNRNHTDNQEERGVAYRNCLRQWVACPFMIGCQWFAVGDSIALQHLGREITIRNANWGLWDEQERPYMPFFTYASQANYKAGHAERDDSWDWHKAARIPEK